ncbi:MAG: bifunctional (p)ppGpp synthetase/guanosine-3',5'-bis(diphosphate) 3'-pyrophosphohydrolase [Rhizobiales bacterium]|nr:bifunctional (p)ppGpp synthetase/guanosine-3',5'-bis(diphosphate) 3'-pyrophosphohydrolase [Hyphomicrobiales bacterium]
MMRQYELVERVTSYDPDANEDLLNRAYVYAMRAHGHQKRASGEAYFNHPLEVAAILTELKLDDATIAAALLHDVVEDTAATRQEIEEKFGHEIAELVDGLTKIKRLDLVTKEATQAENLRKLLVAISKDVRVLLVKLADRLHNMRTLEHVPPEKRLRIAQETMDIYAPLAGRMGMQNVRDELEDIAFKVLNPDAYATVKKRLDRLHEESGGALLEIEKALQAKFTENGIDAEVSGREKKAYSIWRKMERKHLSLGQLSDIFGFRVIVPSIEQCYLALGVVHRTWRAVPGRFKDYISTPKQNDYRSLHTTVIGPHHMRVEMQIRTRDMHEIAERGVAAHALYKDVTDPRKAMNGARVPAAESNAYRWLRHLVEMLSEGESPKEFLEHTKLELFHDQVFCFTPKGQLIALPKGATPIDFAYAVHTSIGDSCVGCRINGRHKPLATELENGDEVDIIRSEAQVPPAAWEGLAVTGKARSAIRRATRAAVRRQYAGLGREILDRLLAKSGKSLSENTLQAATPKLGHRNVEDALAAIGRGELAASDMLKAMGIEVKEAGARKKRSAAARPKSESEEGVPVRGAARGTALAISLETGAVPGERIVGILTPGQGITVYPIFAKALEKFDAEPERWIDLTWDAAAEDQRFPARIKVTIHNEVGALAQVAQTIGESGGNIDELQMVTRGVARDFFDLDILLEVHDLKHLNEIMAGLRARPLVSAIERATG